VPAHQDFKKGRLARGNPAHDFRVVKAELNAAARPDSTLSMPI
jgi:hypothetical protein